MKKIIRILILCFGCIGACWLLPACSSAIEEPESGGGGDGSTVTLTIQAAVPDGTRADGSEVPDREKIDQLWIIVVDQTTHKVEHNQLHRFSYPEDEYNIEVEKNSTKDVYFLANAESWCSDIPGVGEIYNPDEDESEGDESDDGIIVAKTTTMPSLFNQKITNLPENRLPYTSKYEIKVEDENVEATCYIAIAAVKFDIDFNNYTERQITIKSLEIVGIADQSYLFPHNDKWDEWVSDITGSNTYKDYFTDYDIPENTVHENFPVPIPSTPGNDATQENSGGNNGMSFEVSAKSDSESGSGSYTIPTFYCHESKNKTESNKQQYFIQFEIDDKVFISEIKTGSESLASLIRSTHVKITVNINSLEQKDEAIIISGEIVDWNWLEEVTGDIEEVEEQSES